MHTSDFQLAVDLARGLHQAGAPSWRVEHGVEALGRATGRSFTCFAVPTGLHITDGDRVVLIKATGGDVDLTAQHALERTVRAPAPRAALRHTLAALDRRPAVLAPTIVLAHTALGTGAGLLLDGQIGTAVGGGLGGLVTGLLAVRASRGEGDTSRASPLLASLASTLLAPVPLLLGLPTSPAVAALCGILYLLPGLSLTIGVGEVAAGHSSAGAARLTTAAVLLLLLGLGMAAGDAFPVATATATTDRVIGAAPLGLWLTIGSLGLLFRARRTQLPWVAAGITLSWALPTLLAVHGPTMAAFLTAALLGVAGNLLHRHNRMPPQVLTLPGILMLVPGGSSLRAVGALLRHDLLGIEILADSIATAGALVAGLLVAGLALPPSLRSGDGPAAAQPGG